MFSRSAFSAMDRKDAVKESIRSKACFIRNGTFSGVSACLLPSNLSISQGRASLFNGRVICRKQNISEPQNKFIV